MRGSSANIQTPTHCNLIACSMTSPPSVLLPSSILPPPSSHWAFDHTKGGGGGGGNSYRISKIFFFSYVFKNCVDLKLSKSKSVCTAPGRSDLKLIVTLHGFTTVRYTEAVSMWGTEDPYNATSPVTKDYIKRNSGCGMAHNWNQWRTST